MWTLAGQCIEEGRELMIKVSVITPTFNSAKYVFDTYASLQAQTLTDWEWVITDDGSSDQTPAILKGLAERDPRLNLEFSHENLGPAVARNRSIERANGRYLAFLDADDQWLPEKLEKQILFMEENKHAFTHTWYQPVNEQGLPVGRVVKAPLRLSYRELLKSNRVGCLTAVYDVQMLGKVFMPVLRKRQDYGLWLDLLKRMPYVYCLSECLALYRVAPGSISSNKAEMLKYHWKLYREVEKFSIPTTVYYLVWNIARRILK